MTGHYGRTKSPLERLTAGIWRSRLGILGDFAAALSCVYLFQVVLMGWAWFLTHWVVGFFHFFWALFLLVATWTAAAKFSRHGLAIVGWLLVFGSLYVLYRVVPRIELVSSPELGGDFRFWRYSLQATSVVLLVAGGLSLLIGWMARIRSLLVPRRVPEPR